MASGTRAQGIRAGAAYIELFVNDSRLVRGLASAQKKLAAFGTAVTGWGRKVATAGAAITAPFVAAGRLFSEVGDRIAKASGRTGIAAETLSELAFAADLSGANLKTLETAIRKMQKSIVDAAEGSQTAVDALAMLNLTVDDLRGLSPDGQFKLIADRLSQIQSPAVRAAVAMDLFGKSGTQLLPMMADGAAGIEALQKQARDLGLTMSTEDAKSAEALNDAMDMLFKVLKHGVFVIGAALAPTLQDLSEWLTELIVSVNRWVRENRQLIVTAFKIAAALLAAGVAILALGAAGSALGAVFGVIAGVITGTVVVIKVLLVALAAILSPIGLIITAVVALGGYILYATGLGGKALQWLGDRFSELASFASESFGGIADALVAGDIALAAKILWLSLQVIFQNGVLQLTRLWESLKTGALKIVYGLWYGVQAAWEIGTTAISGLMLRLYYGVMDVWQRMSTGMMNAWDETINWVSKRMIDLWGLVDDSLDTGAVKQQLEQDANRRISERNKEKNAAVDQIAKERDAALKALGDDHEQNLVRIGQASLDADRQLDAEAQKKVDAAQAQLDQARREWQDAIGQAKQKRQLRDAAGPEQLNRPPDLADYLENLAPAIADAQQRTIGVAGTFNAMEAPGLGAGGVADRIAKSSEETARNTKRILQEVEEMDPAEFD